MFENIISKLIGKYLDKYIQNLDTKNLQLGILNGKLEVKDLQLKPEAFYELDLPIEVKRGCVGSLSLQVPWMKGSNLPVVVNIEDLLVVAGPRDTGYDPQRDLREMRASKQLHLQQVEDRNSPFTEENFNFYEKLVSSLVQRIQIHANNIHICYEDSVTNPGHPFVCGIAVYGITAETTSNKWKPTEPKLEATTIYKLIKMDSLSVYWNPFCSAANLTNPDPTFDWKNEMKQGLQEFRINGDPFEYVLKPVSPKVKLIMKLDSEPREPKLLVDIVINDASLQLSQLQYLCACSLRESFLAMEANRRFHKYKPGVVVRGKAKTWWHYAQSAVIGELVSPYSWQSISKHRKNYRNYKTLYKGSLSSRHATLPEELQLLEDNLSEMNILLAREEARLEFARENPANVITRKMEAPWWKFWSSEDVPVTLEIDSDIHQSSLFSPLTPDEKAQLHSAIGYSAEVTAKLGDKPKQYIEHKVDLTIADCTLSLKTDHDVATVTLAHLVTSIETRPSAQAFHLSFRSESFLLEGATSDQDLVRVISADQPSGGLTSVYVFALNLDKNPLNVNGDFALTLHTEPIEVVYNQHAFCEMMSFFQLPSAKPEESVERIGAENLHRIANVGKSLIEHTINTRKKWNLRVEMKSPFFVIPELGNTQKGGNVLVVDFGMMTIKSDLQDREQILEDGTPTEIEERLYDRFSVTIREFQVLFADSGEEWRAARMGTESKCHLVPKVSASINLCNTICPEYKYLPRQKLNVKLPSVKVNLSDRRIRQLAEFFQNLPQPTVQRPRSLHMDVPDGPLEHSTLQFIVPSQLVSEPTVSELQRIRRSICRAGKVQSNKEMYITDSISPQSITSRPASSSHFPASDNSGEDEEPEEWARNVDLPGFDDNVSHSNTILVRLQFTVAEVLVQLARSNDYVDKPYLMLRLEKMFSDIAIMGYGPAVQVSLGGLQLVDKLHTRPLGEYLELLKSTGCESSPEIINILYRKVRSNCPEFRKHFHSVEQSLVLSLSKIEVNFHRGAVLTLIKFTEYITERIKPKGQTLKSLPAVHDVTTRLWSADPTDPPVPHGATKLSVSARIEDVCIRLCDSDMDLLELIMSGLETDFILKANDKMILRTYLNNLSVEDCSDLTSYPKILTLEDDKVFDFKYVRHSPHPHKQQDIYEDDPTMKTDASVRIKVGRIRFTLLYKFLADFQRFLEPFIQPGITLKMHKTAGNQIQEQITNIQNHGTKLSLSVDIHAPVLIIPQKSDSCNMLILRLGDLSVENFFKEVTVCNGTSPKHVIDNVLFRLCSVQMNRAVLLQDGAIEELDAILEPVKMRLDLKRAISHGHRDILLYEFQGGIETVKMSFGQRDLGVIVAIFKENMQEGQFMEQQPSCRPTSPLDANPSPVTADDTVGKTLQAFFKNSVDVTKKANVTFSLEGIHLVLVNDDLDQDLQMGGASRGLSKFELEDVSLSTELFSDDSMEMKCSLLALSLEDIRQDGKLAVRKIFQSYSGDSKIKMGDISVSTCMPPMVDVTYKRNGNGDVEVNVLVEKTRLNLSVPYILALSKFLCEAWPPEASPKGGIVNPCFTGEQSTQGKCPECEHRRPRQTSSSDCTSGYHSSPSPAPEETPREISIGAKLKKPEVILLADPTCDHSRVLVVKADLILDYNSHLRQASLEISAVGLRIMSCVYGKRRQTAYMVMQPCDVDFCAKSTDEGTESKMAVGKVELRVSQSTVHTVRKVTQDLISSLKSEEDHAAVDAKDADLRQDLWSPRKLSQHRLHGNQDKDTRLQSKDTRLQSTNDRGSRVSETFTLLAPSVQIACEMEHGLRRIPVIVIGAGFEAKASDWSTMVSGQGEITLKASYYNEKISTWEPLLEDIPDQDGGYKPWTLNFLVSQLPAQPITSSWKQEEREVETDGPIIDKPAKPPRLLSSSSDDSECERDMIVIKGRNVHSGWRSAPRKSDDTGSLSEAGSDSYDEDENGALEKLSRRCHMLCSDSSPEESESEAEDLTNAEDDENADDEGADSDASVDGLASPDSSKAVFLRSQGTEEVPDVPEPRMMATYMIIESHDALEFTVTPTAIAVVTQVCQSFVNPVCSSSPNGKCNGATIYLNNRLGCRSCVTLLQNSQDDQALDDKKQVLATSKYPTESMDVPSPSTTALLVDISSSESDIDLEREEVDRFSVSSALTRADSAQIADDALVFGESTDATLYQRNCQMRVTVEIDGFDALECYLPPKTGATLRVLHPQMNDTRYHVVIDREFLRSRSTYTVRSPMKIRNRLSHEMEVYYKKTDLDKLGVKPTTPTKNPFEFNVLLTTIPPESFYDVPLFIAYHCPLQLRPANLSYNITEDEVWWQELLSTPTQSKMIRCHPKNDIGSTPFSIKVSCCDGVSQGTSSLSGMSIPNMVINLLHPLVIRNRLPYAVEMEFTTQMDRVKLNPGEERSLCNVDLVTGHAVKVELPNYLSAPWSGKIQLHGEMEMHLIPMTCDEEPHVRRNRKLSLLAEVDSKSSLQLTLSSPYWIVNKSGLPVQLKGKKSDNVYDTSWVHDEPILFRFKRRKSMNVKMRVYNSKWSYSFSLDAVGIWGVVECVDKERKKKFEFMVNVQQSAHPNTKILVILPYLLVSNETKHHLRFMEHNDKADLWVDIAPNQKTPFWPETTSRRMYIKFKDSEVSSQAFPIDSCHNTVLRMYRGTAMQVNVHGGDSTSPRIITFHPYTDGCAPTRVDNNCEDLVLKIHQKSMGQVILLKPNQSVLYTWDDPTKERTLMWSNYPGPIAEFPAFINKDGHGKQQLSIHTVRQSDVAPNTKLGGVRSRTSHQSSSSDDESDIDVEGESDWYIFSRKTRKDKVIVYWVSYLDDNQRVLLFTQDEGIVTKVQHGLESPKAALDICVSLGGVGISLVSDSCVEVAYVNITSSPAIWEYESSHRWRPFQLKQATCLEDLWRSEPNHNETKDAIQVDFNKMQMLKPHFAQLRRRSKPGVWIQHRSCATLSYSQIKIHRFQIDNQLQDAHFMTVLYPAPVSRFRGNRVACQRSFVKLVLARQFSPGTATSTVKNCQLLIQDFCVQLDKGFLYSVFNIFYTLPTTQDTFLLLNQDVELTSSSLATYLTHNEAQFWTNGIVVEYLHLSPVKITFSFSPRGTTHKVHSRPHTRKGIVMDLFLSTVGALMTEVTNVTLLMTYYEAKDIRTPLYQLLDDILGQYRLQLLQQSYVLIFGLDILGNPYALIHDFTKGLGDYFYEPSAARPINPGEHAAAVSLGVQHLTGLVIGGAVGSASLIAGSIGNLLANLSFDDDFKKARRARQQKSSSIKGHFANTGRTFLSGIILGLSGIITSPISGARQDGVEGFFRGAGQGLMGLLAKSIGGTVDLISMSLDGVRRAMEMGKVIIRSRQPRYVNPYVGVRPYCTEKAKGWYLLLQVDKGHYPDNDVYWSHAELKKEERSEMVLVTDRNIFLVQKKRLWGEWSSKMVIRVQDIIALPHISGNKLILKVRQDERVSEYTNERFICSEDLDVLKMIKDKIEEVLMSNLMGRN